MYVLIYVGQVINDLPWGNFDFPTLFITYVTIYLSSILISMLPIWYLGFSTKFQWTMSDMVKYRAAIWSFLKLTALYFTMSDIVHVQSTEQCPVSIRILYIPRLGTGARGSGKNPLAILMVRSQYCKSLDSLGYLSIMQFCLECSDRSG